MKKNPFLLMALLCLSFLFTGCPGGVPDDDLNNLDPTDGSIGEYNLTATAGMTSVVFTWDKVPEADKYRVYCLNEAYKSRNWEQTLNCTVTMKNYKPGESLTFQWEALKSDDSKICDERYTVKLLTKGPLEDFHGSAPEEKGVVSIWLYWDAIPQGSDIVSAKLYKKLKSEADYTFLAELDKEKTCSGVYQDTDVKKNSVYSYKAVTYDADGSECGTSETEVGVDPSVPVVPENLAITKTTFTTFELAWDEVEGAAQYIVYYKASYSKYEQVGEFTEPKGIVQITKDMKNSYLLPTFVVSAKNSAGESAKSEEVTGNFISIKDIIEIKSSEKYTFETTQTTATVTFPPVDIEKTGDAKITYAVAKNYISSVSSASESDWLVKPQDSNVVKLENLTFNTSNYLYFYVFVSYKLSDNNEYSEYTQAYIPVQTKALPAPANVKVKEGSVGRGSVTITFDKVTELFGLSPSDLEYYVQVYTKDENGEYTKYVSFESKSYAEAGDSPSITVKEITQDTTCRARVTICQSYSSDKNVYSEWTDEFTTKSGLAANPQITNISSSANMPGESGLQMKYPNCQTCAKISFSCEDKDKLDFYLKYMIQSGCSYTEVKGETNIYFDGTDLYAILNAGNKYKLQLIASYKDEPTCVYKSEDFVSEKIGECKPDLNDSNVQEKLKNAVFDKNTSNILDLTDWSGTCRSTTGINSSTYNFGFPSVIDGKVSQEFIFKVSIDGTHQYATRLILLLNQGSKYLSTYKVDGQDYTLGTCKVYYCTPEGDVISPNVTNSFEHPTFDLSGKTSEYVPNAGFVLDEKYAYDGAIYLKIHLVESSKIVGVSYYN